MLRIKHIMLGLLSVAALASCSVQEELQPTTTRRHFRAVLEQSSTRAYSDQSFHFFWNADDRVSIFDGQTSNQQFFFTGDNGDTAGSFDPVGEAPSGPSSAIQNGYSYSIYPYSENNGCDSQGTLTVVFPEQQPFYDEGVGLRPLMAARSKDGDFYFKHLGAYVGVRLVGEGVTVASISFQSNGFEALAGPASVTFNNDGLPSVALDQAQGKSSITMTLETPVALDAEEAKVFWLNIPACSLSGYTLTIMDPDGGIFQKVRTTPLTLERAKTYDLDATVEITPVPLDEHSYTKASTITAGGTYLIVDATDDQRVFKGAKDGSFVSVSPENDIITDTDGSLAAYEFTVEQSEKGYYLKFNDGNYLVCDYSNSGNTTTGIRYVATQDLVQYPYSLTVADGVFFFSTTKIDSGSPDQILYYKPINAPNSGTDRFKIGGTGSDYGVHLYMKGGKRARGLKFEPENVTCLQGNNPEKPVLSGTYTTLTWTSENTAVATVDGNGDVTIVGVGTTTITAEAEEDTYYQAGSASYTLTVIDSDTASYVKATAITVGGTYLIVSVDDDRLFKGSKDGAYISVSPENGVIIDYDRNLSAYEFTVEQNGSNYYLKFNDGKYLVCDYSNNGDGQSGLCYVETQSAVRYPYALTTSNGAFMFSTTQVSNTSSTNQVLYYKPAELGGTGPDRFKIGGSGAGVGVHLYLKGGKQDRGLKFEPESVTCLQGNTPEKPVLSGTYSTVSYSSDNTNVATVNATNGTVTVTGVGMATITATVEADDDYLAGTASYTLTILDPNGSSYTKVSTLTVGGTYLIVSVDDDRLFKGSKDGAYISIAPENGVIIDRDRTLSAYEFTVEQNGSNYYLKFNDGKYLVCDYRNNGDGQSGLCYVETQSAVRYPYALTTSNGAFMFSTTQVSSTSSTNQVLYYKPAELGGTGPDRFKIGGSGAGVGVHLYLKGGGGGTPAKLTQTISFSQPTVTWPLGQGYELNGSYALPQTVTGNKTSVTYTSETPEVVTFSNNLITIVAAGSATIKATAAETDEYYGSTTTFTLNIATPAPEGWVDLKSFNLENAALKAYLNEAESTYEDNNEQTVTCVSKYVSQYSSISRQDCPAPVTITWTNPASSNTVVTIYSDEGLTTKVLSPVKASANATSAEVYNLVPGCKYWYTVSENGSIWEKGYFNTTGRRRMLKISDTLGKGHANNCRDLGGMITKDGTKRIKYGYIYRGSNMDSTTPDEKSLLYNDLNIRLDLDLRSGSGSSNSGVEGNSTAYQPFSTSQYSMAYFKGNFSQYSDIINHSDYVKNSINKLIDTVLAGDAVYFHCWVGADRTGFFGLLIEGMLGISEAVCSMDYEMTSFSSKAGIRGRDGKPTNNDHYWGHEGSDKGLALLRSQTGDTFEQKCTNYLTSIGVSDSKIADFKKTILVSINNNN